MPKAFVQKKLWIAVVGTVLSLGLAVFVSQFANYIGFENLPPLSIINITLDISGMIIGIIIMIGLYLDKRKIGTTPGYLAGIIVVTYIALCTDALEYIMDGISYYRDVNLWVTVIYYMTIPAEAVLFWHYSINYLNIPRKNMYKINCVIEGCFITALVIRLLNVLFPVYFTLDEMNQYHRTIYYPLSKVFFLSVCSMTLYLIMRKRKQFNTTQLASVFLFGLGPLVASLVAIYVRGLSATPIVTMIGALFMYCVLNVLQGREQAVSEHEMGIAASIQENVLPKAFPYLPERKEFELYAVMKPAKDVGGDFYDFFMVDDRHLALVIADVSGKGIPAALFMMTSRTLLKNRLQAESDLGKIMFDVNNQLCEGNVADMFITVWAAVIDLQTGEGVEINAGHENPIIKRVEGLYESVYYKHDMAVAMMPNTHFHERSFKLNPGDRLFVFTDGVTEAVNVDEKLFSTRRLIDALNEDPFANPKAAIENVMEAVDKFSLGTEQADDTTMLCFHYMVK